MSPGLRPIAMRWEDGTVVLRLAGELDLAVADDLDFSARWLAGSSADHVVIDLAELTFIDAVGLRAIRRARDTVVAGGRTVAVVNPAPAVARVFEVTGAEDLLG